MKTVNTLKADSKIVVFEPGNCTRYYLVLTQTSQWNFVMADMNNHKMVEFSAEWLDEMVYKIRLQEKGYSSGDAEPMAKYLVKAFKERAYITYRTTDERTTGVEYITQWFEDTSENWEQWLTHIGEQGYQEYERGILDWFPAKN